MVEGRCSRGSCGVVAAIRAVVPQQQQQQWVAPNNTHTTTNTCPYLPACLPGPHLPPFHATTTRPPPTGLEQSGQMDVLAARVENAVNNNCGKRAILIGHSMGGLVATALTQRDPEWR